MDKTVDKTSPALDRRDRCILEVWQIRRVEKGTKKLEKELGLEIIGWMMM